LNKALILEQIIARLTLELEGYARSARSAHAEATDEQSKAENKYDTRGLEASYLAHGQMQQAAGVIAAIREYEGLEPRAFAAAEPIDLGALVELETKGERLRYFIGASAGGSEIVVENLPITVITPQSPLGRQLVGKKAGDSFEMQIGPRRERARVKEVS
jgi:transcription elongation GreA/GreB family factor